MHLYSDIRLSGKLSVNEMKCRGGRSETDKTCFCECFRELQGLNPQRSGKRGLKPILGWDSTNSSVLPHLTNVLKLNVHGHVQKCNGLPDDLSSFICSSRLRDDDVPVHRRGDWETSPRLLYPGILAVYNRGRSVHLDIKNLHSRTQNTDNLKLDLTKES